MSDPYEIVAYELVSKMRVGTQEYGNMAIITSFPDSVLSELSDVSMCKIVAENMDDQYLKAAGCVLESREWACRPLTQQDLRYTL